MKQFTYKFIGDDSIQTLIEDSKRFKSQVKRSLHTIGNNSSFYRKRIDGIGLDPETQPLEVLLRIEPTTKTDYRDSLQFEALAQLQSQPFFSTFSSGSTTGCVLRFSTPVDELAELEITERVFRRAGMCRGDHFVCMEIGVPEIYDFYLRAGRMCGAKQTTFLKITSDYSASIAPLARLDPTILLTIPSVMVRAWPYIQSFWPPGQSPIKSVIHMGEPTPPKLKTEIETKLGCKVYSFYGTTEVGGIGGECFQGSGFHFDPHLVCAAVENPQYLDENTVQGKGLFSTLHFRHQAVINYHVDDIVRLTLKPCPCGEPTPLVTFIERTNDRFIITGEKFRYDMILEGIKFAAPELNYMTITLTDVPETEGNTLMTLSIPDEFRSKSDDILQTLQYEIFELDTAFHNGFVRFELNFQPPELFDSRKIKRVRDLRKYLGE